MFQVDRDENAAALDNPRTKELSLLQIAEIDKQTFEKEKKLLRVQYGISEHYNPLLRIPADLYRYYLCNVDNVLYRISTYEMHTHNSYLYNHDNY